MKNSIRLLVIVLVAVAAVGVVHAAGTQVHADQGKPGNQGPWPVSLTGSADGGTSISVTEAPCINPRETVITFDAGGATSCPITALAGRRTLTICNSPRNTGTPLWTVRADGVAPTTATSSPGQTLNKSDCITYFMAATLTDGGVPTKCISDLADSVITMTECK